MSVQHKIVYYALIQFFMVSTALCKEASTQTLIVVTSTGGVTVRQNLTPHTCAEAASLASTGRTVEEVAANDHASTLRIEWRQSHEEHVPVTAVEKQCIHDTLSYNNTLLLSAGVYPLSCVNNNLEPYLNTPTGQPDTVRLLPPKDMDDPYPVPDQDNTKVHVTSARCIP